MAKLKALGMYPDPASESWREHVDKRGNKTHYLYMLLPRIHEHWKIYVGCDNNPIKHARHMNQTRVTYNQYAAKALRCRNAYADLLDRVGELVKYAEEFKEEATATRLL